MSLVKFYPRGLHAEEGYEPRRYAGSLLWKCCGSRVIAGVYGWVKGAFSGVLVR